MAKVGACWQGGRLPPASQRHSGRQLAAPASCACPAAAGMPRALPHPPSPPPAHSPMTSVTLSAIFLLVRVTTGPAAAAAAPSAAARGGSALRLARSAATCRVRAKAIGVGRVQVGAPGSAVASNLCQGSGCRTGEHLIQRHRHTAAQITRRNAPWRAQRCELGARSVDRRRQPGTGRCTAALWCRAKRKQCRRAIGAVPQAPATPRLLWCHDAARLPSRQAHIACTTRPSCQQRP